LRDIPGNSARERTGHGNHLFSLARDLRAENAATICFGLSFVMGEEEWERRSPPGCSQKCQRVDQEIGGQSQNDTVFGGKGKG